MYEILNKPTVPRMETLFTKARRKYTTKAADTSISKLYFLKHKLCYAYYQNTYTAGHISDQRSEGGMSSIKANGKLKKYLSECTFGESVSRVSQVSRTQDLNTLKELVRCREKGMQVGEKYTEALKNSKVVALGMSYVESIEDMPHCYEDKMDVDSPESCTVNIATVTGWRDMKFTIVSGSCFYSRSTRMTCPCACTAMQRLNMDLDSIDIVHPCWRIRFHPLFQEACC